MARKPPAWAKSTAEQSDEWPNVVSSHGQGAVVHAPKRRPDSSFTGNAVCRTLSAARFTNRPVNCPACIHLVENWS